MARFHSRQRLLLILAALPVLLVFLATTYRIAMHHLEGEERSFWDSIEWAAETLTTTGYGADAEWDHPAMILFVVGLQFFGVFLVYMIVPFFLLPLLEERIGRRLPKRLRGGTRDHVVIVRFGAAVETLLEELTDAGIPTVLADLDPDGVRRSKERVKRAGRRFRQVQVLHESSRVDLLKAAQLPRARALLLNGDDEENAAAALISRELGFEGDVLALVEEPANRQALRAAGATEVFTPRFVLGEALAARASQRVQPRIDGIHHLGKNLRVDEIWVSPESELVGRTLGEANIGARTGTTVLGIWARGHLDAKPSPNTRIEPRTLLLAIGRPEAIDELTLLATGGLRRRASGPFVIAGYGEVGREVVRQLREAGEPVLIVDERKEREEIDIHGDIVDPELLESLDLDRAQGVILAIDSDKATLFATLVLAGKSPDLPIIARVNRAENIDRLYRAGADFALSLSQVSAQILTRRLLHRSTVALDTELRLLATPTGEYPDLVHQHPSALEIRRRTGCSVVAVERNDEVLTHFDGTFSFQPGDGVYICGHRTDTERFVELYGRRRE